MKQVYSPNLGVPATRGWCLKYVDDAGNAPNRQKTARAAFNVEAAAGRIKRVFDPIPPVWVVGWLDFTTGPFTNEGHVFFVKKEGNSYLVYDSEVQSGARVILQNGQWVNLGPYKSLDELLSWFSWYNPVYIGWSTHCDGREYASDKKGKIMSEDAVRYSIRGVTGQDVPFNDKTRYEKEVKYWTGRNDVEFGKYLLGLGDQYAKALRKQVKGLEADLAKDATQLSPGKYLVK